MKMQRLLFLLLGAALLTGLAGCLRDTCSSTRTYVRYDPVYKTLAECRVGLTAEGPRELKKPGKIYYFDHYLLITELNEGIHVIDNSDPARPTPVAFWNIPGNVDLAVRDHYLYADQYIDLLTIDISNIQQPQVVCRAENVFALLGFDPARGYLVEYAPTKITEEIACDDPRWSNQWFWEGDVLFAADNAQTGGPIKKNSGLPSGTGVSGSYSRFGQTDGFLYCVDNSTLRPFSLASPACPSALAPIGIGWNIETIFPWKDRLFVGSQTGVFIFNASNPAQPVQEAVFNHASGCDPVVCDGDFAYVTIHDGTTCQGTFNQLDVINIKNLPSASLLKTYPMTKPKGLSVAGDYLYLCDDGLKVMDKTDPANIKELAHLKGMQTYDVIALDETHLLVIGDDGFYQYDVSKPDAPKEISHIAVTP